MAKIGSLEGIVEFVAAADAGSFSAAARVLGVSVAHVSRKVAELEAGLGLQLIQRTSRQSVLTDAGREYHARCRSALDELEEAREGLRRDRDDLLGPIKVGVGGHFAEGYVMPLLLDFAARHPGISVHIDLSSRNADIVEEGFDLAVRAGPLAASSLVARRLVGFPLVTLASPALLERTGPIAHPDRLDPAACLGLGERGWSFRKGRDERSIVPAGRIRSNDGATLVTAATASMGIAQVPGYYGRRELREGRLVAILTDWTPPEPFEFHLVFPPQRRMARRVRELADHLTAGIRQAVGGELPSADT